MRKSIKTVLFLFVIVFICVGCNNGVESKNVPESENIPVETPCVSTPAPTASPELVAGKDALLEETTNTGKDVDLDSWVGSYYYIETFPHFEDSDFHYFISYDINIYEDDGNYYGEIINDGWQTQVRMLTQIKGTDDAIDIIYIETSPGDSQYGKYERFDKGDILLSFKRENEKIITTWGLLKNQHPTLCDEDEVVGEYYIRKDMDEDILSHLERYLENRKSDTTGMYNNYYLEEDKVCVIVRIFNGYGDYFIVELPLE